MEIFSLLLVAALTAGRMASLNLLRNYSKRPHLQNKGNVTSKEIRSQQIEATVNVFKLY